MPSLRCFPSSKNRFPQQLPRGWNMQQLWHSIARIARIFRSAASRFVWKQDDAVVSFRDQLSTRWRCESSVRESHTGKSRVPNSHLWVDVTGPGPEQKINSAAPGIGSTSVCPISQVFWAYQLGSYRRKMSNSFYMMVFLLFVRLSTLAKIESKSHVRRKKQTA